MLKVVSTLIRGAVAEAEDAVFDANAIRILEQQLRDAASSLEHARRELACVMAHRASEQRAAVALAARIGELESSALQALKGDREDLAGEAATVIAATEDELKARRATTERLVADIERLKRLAEDGRRRLTDLRRGLETARAQEALRRAGANGRRALVAGSGALRDAEATLARIQAANATDEDGHKALEELEKQASGADLDERLSTAGFGSNAGTRPADVLARIKGRMAGSRDGSSETSP